MNSTAPQRDLVRQLMDKDTRRTYLHPRKPALRQVLWRMYVPVRKSPRMVLVSVGYALTNGVLPLLGVLVTYVLVGLLSKTGTTPQSMLLAAAVYGMAFMVCGALSQQLLYRNHAWFARERLKLLSLRNLKVMTMDYGLYENPSFMDDIQSANWSFSSNNNGLEGTFHKVFEMGGTLVSALLLAALLSTLSPLVALSGVVAVIVSYASQAHVGAYKHQRREALMRVSRRVGMLSSQAADFRAGKDLRLYGVAGRFQQVFEPILDANMRLYRAFTKRELQVSVPENLTLIVLDLVSALLLTRRYLQGAITMAELVMLISAVVLFSRVMMELAQQLSFVKTETLYVQDAFDFLDANLNSLDGQEDIPGEGPVAVTFEDVSFRYPGTERLVLEHLSFSIAPGERCALVGLNGVGKTTLVKLLLGLYLPSSGRILINGVDSAHVRQQTLFSLFGVVFQQVEPLALTIAETVAASVDTIDRGRVEESLKTAGLWEKVQSLAKGMDTPLLKIIHEDGAILSGGENQKLMIARALYREHTRMMVMDEPTAALDALAEQAIYQQFDALLKGRTALFISHRLASTRFCDRILLLNGGRVAQHGTHEELLRQPGLYQQLFTTQGKYYQDQGEDTP